ncbi:4-(cytidine 5'-diphospho)-2-C-methyl-D-erythritol kinase [Flavobacteriales bacterium]|jgi:4-diphosphocytidyl-2-C-methyl-D-erythritol kinase|nr:4-(cytidine 5'-diphospho)-2-C-methyl-D-erythritol kinase [Flavobacteriales bacterium]
MILYPNAKINIGLNVLNKREDGYHELSSVFYPVSELYDILEIIISDDFSFSSSGFSIPGNSNICTRAFDLLKADYDVGNVKIHLHKMIPIGAGLGGGSADGAFILKAMNELFELNLTNNQLEKYALKLGADCPFFIENTPKYVTGIGEQMTAIDLDLSDYDIKFIFPELHISTTEAYGSIIPKKQKINLLDLISKPIINWKAEVRNDFEFSAFKKHPELLKMKENLYADGAIYASMTGSGSVIYGVLIK